MPENRIIIPGGGQGKHCPRVVIPVQSGPHSISLQLGPCAGPMCAWWISDEEGNNKAAGDCAEVVQAVALDSLAGTAAGLAEILLKKAVDKG
jgi:hypothetical protein